MNFRRHLLLTGIILSFIFLSISVLGFSVYLYYCLLFILFFLLFPCVPIARKEPSFKSFICIYLIICLFSFIGAVLGHGGRKYYIRFRVCRACEPVLVLIEKYHLENGDYPENFEAVKGIADIRKKTGITIQRGKYSYYGIDLLDTDKFDATLYLKNNKYFCLIPVTKKVPMSITRFYAYGWSSDKPEWTYDKIIWFIATSTLPD